MTAVRLSSISPFLLRWFGWYGRRFIARHFHSLRLLRSSAPPPDTEQPTVFYLNHPGWWDPMVAFHLVQMFFPRQHAYCPIDAEALRKYPFLGKLGFFPVQRDSLRGARDFLQQANAILAQPHHTLWLTPQGGFTDVRQRPVRFAAGLGHLARKHPTTLFVPVAIEYAWWHERGAEILVAFGPGMAFSEKRGATELRQLCEAALESLQDRLAAASLRREAAAFEVLISGRTGVGGLYDVWRRLCACLRGESFDPRHLTDSTSHSK